MEKCVIYSRVSSQQQNYESQKEALIKYATNDNKYEVAGIWGENVSGYDQTVDRDEYDKMKEFVVSNNIKLILMWELSRLGRSTLKMLKEIEFFKEHGVNIFFKKENLNTISNDPTNKLTLSILSSMAEMERDTLMERMGRGRTSSVMKGKRTGYCFLPYGFSADENSKLIIDPIEALIVQEIYDRYVNGDTMRSIAINLNTRNVPTRHTTSAKNKLNKFGKKIEWRNNSIYSILTNCIYKGERLYKGQTIIIDQIVEPAKWDRVKDMLAKNVGYYKARRVDNETKVEHKYLFKSKIFCGHCEYMFQTRTELRYPNHPSYYFCNGRFNLSIKCTTGQFKSDMIDDVLYKNVFSPLNSRIKRFFFDEYQSSNNIDDMKKQIIELQCHIKEMRAEMEKNNDMYRHNYLTPAKYHSLQAENSREITTTENNIKQIERDIIKYSYVDIDAVIEKVRFIKDYDTQFEYVQKYVDKVLIYEVTDYKREEFLKNTKTWKNAKNIGISAKTDKIIYAELFAFGTNNPLKIVLSSWTKRYCYGKTNIQYDGKTKSLSITDFNIQFY